MTGTTISHYKILEKLGEGGMGVVYKAHDTNLNRDVALKFLPQSVSAHEPERARFQQEAQAAAALNHPHICAIHSISEAGEQQYIEMEYVDGVTLRKKIEDGGLRIEDGIGYAIQIAEALQEAHCHGIVHRDVKADNIMVNSKNQVKVMDFGLAKLKGSLHLTKTSSTIGTLAYMAPEQIEGGEVDARSDIFSFGIVLYEMLTGHLPFRGEHEAAIVYSIVNEEPAPLQTYLPDPQPELLHILQRALAKDPEDRYQTIQEMLIDLRLLKEDSARVSREVRRSLPTNGKTREKEGPSEPRKGPAKSFWWVAAALGTICAVAALVVLLRRPSVHLNPNKTAVAIRLPFDEIEYPSLSRDGRWLAFPAREDDGTCELYWMNVADGKPNQVTNDHIPTIYNCDISPDFSRIAYGTQEGTWAAQPARSTYKVKLVSTQGGVSQTLADPGNAPRWNPDGTRIGYLRIGRGGSFPAISGKFEIWSVKPDGTDNRLELLDTAFVRRDPRSFCWSPDGRSIAWVRNYADNYGEVIIRELASGKEKQLTSERAIVDEVVWTENDMILFMSTRSGQSNLWMIPAGGGEPAQLTLGTVPVQTARISSDTKRILQMQREFFGQIWNSAIDGSKLRRVTRDEVRFTYAQYSPDGNTLAGVMCDVDEFKKDARLCVMNREAENCRVLTPSSELVTRCCWSTNGNWIAYDSYQANGPADSNKVYLVEPSNPGAPIFLCRGDLIRWTDDEHLAVWSEMKTWIYPATGGVRVQLYRDSTRAYTRKGSNLILFRDFRTGRQGWWSVSANRTFEPAGEPRRLAGLDSSMTLFDNEVLSLTSDMRFVVFLKRVGRSNIVSRMRISDGKEERLGLAPLYTMGLADIAPDGKELLWIKQLRRVKLGLIENPFE